MDCMYVEPLIEPAGVTTGSAAGSLPGARHGMRVADAGVAPAAFSEEFAGISTGVWPG